MQECGCLVYLSRGLHCGQPAPRILSHGWQIPASNRFTLTQPLQKPLNFDTPGCDEATTFHVNCEFDGRPTETAILITTATQTLNDEFIRRFLRCKLLVNSLWFYFCTRQVDPASSSWLQNWKMAKLMVGRYLSKTKRFWQAISPHNLIVVSIFLNTFVRSWR